MADIRIIFYSGNEIIGSMESSMETFDVNKHSIPTEILDKIRNNDECIHMSFAIEYGGTQNE